MSDDTLDIDELDDIEADPEPEDDAPESDEERGPGLLSKVGSKVAAPFAQISWGNLISIKTGIIALIAFLLVWLLLVNLAPVRLVLWFWAFPHFGGLPFRRRCSRHRMPCCCCCCCLPFPR